ncbi:hypothetical protein UA45_22770 [Morganella morganii]|uniref:Uncharacterized protein n=1 Tax=Morganella morganii TaxID=582 RepID=A0A0D8L192_MORMO|nr:hypothetical protein UA45_22770 [Morganella morganii]
MTSNENDNHYIYEVRDNAEQIHPPQADTLPRALTYCRCLRCGSGTAPDTIVVTAAKQSRLAPDAAQEKKTGK